jgi:dephospho-CoA kinase
VLELKKIAITGGVSSGKSSVCHLLAQRGAYVTDADKIVHDLLSSDPQIRKKVIDLLGTGILVDGQIDRKLVAEKVFSQPETLKSLELILHPAVFHEMALQYQQVKENPKYNLFVAEVPLLYETESAKLFDGIVVVLASQELCRKRFIESKKGSSASFDQRMQRQMKPTQKAAKADFVLINNEKIEDLEKQVNQLLTKLCSI